MAIVEILVEELSMKEFLQIVLPKYLHTPWMLNENYFIRSFEGKNDLQKNIPNKIKVLSNKFQEPVGIVILRDQDNSDCRIIKSNLLRLCKENGNCPRLVRIVCRELEAWYFGEFEAIAKAYPNFKINNYINKSKYRNPDTINASYELKRILPDFQKVRSAKKNAPYISVENNKSKSFHQTIKGISEFFDSLNV